jgi:hypothetical protein
MRNLEKVTYSPNQGENSAKEIANYVEKNPKLSRGMGMSALNVSGATSARERKIYLGKDGIVYSKREDALDSFSENSAVSFGRSP